MGAEITLDYQKRSKNIKEPEYDDSLYGGIVEEAPLAPGQKSMWFLQQFSQDNIAYNIYRAVEVQQKLDIKVFEGAWQAMILHHVSLRTTFAVENEGPLQRATLAFFLRKETPAYMIPTFFMHIKDFSLTQNGKIDSKSFPVPGREQEMGRPVVTPKNEFEHKIAALWQETLGVDNPSVHDNFFETGGHSLLMMKLHALLEERFGVKISVIELFQYPTIASQADFLKNQNSALTT
ncbi:hypothetical protein JXA70_16990 [candidate division KSB1 bacterium]|nr:hypothetical protein [candidate division KSB1 bacterium]